MDCRFRRPHGLAAAQLLNGLSKTFSALLLVLLSMDFAAAGVREQARRIHDRLAGVPPSAQVLDDMALALQEGRDIDAAYIAMDNSAFYRVTLKNFAAPWTNRDFDQFVELNDYTATVIGMIRDDDVGNPNYLPFTEVLSADILYRGAGGLGLPAYSPSDNGHYRELERRDLDLGDDDVLERTTQTLANGTPLAGVAGVMTTRAAAEAFFVAGTNRAMFRFTLLNHLCNDLEQVTDTRRPPDRIRQDVSRSPGGDSRVFLNNCIGCHSGMDPLAQAFAYHDYDDASGAMVYTPGTVRPKYFNNEDTFVPGFITPNDRWDNYWREGANTWIEWDFGPNSPGGGGFGAASLGRELANSRAFASCQVKKAFRAVCLREPADQTDLDQLNSMTDSFRNNGYRMKRVFAEAATYCKGD
jgi:hypothetical protein